MNYIIIGLLVIVIILVIIAIMKNINESNITERIGKIETNLTKELSEFKYSIVKDINKDFSNLNKDIETRLNLINDKVNERLDANFEKTNKTFSNVVERLAKIDEAQKKIDNLSTDIVSLQSILTDKKSRGIFGETNLRLILSSIFGEKNDNVYKLQHQLSNHTIVDAILFAPNPLGTVAIDSKFPLENYKNMVDKTLTVAKRESYTKLFKTDVKKHIDAISEKYIINGETTNQAIMFLPAEAIFAEINAYHEDIVRYAYNKKIWITSPTTLMSMLTIVQTILTNQERDKYTSIIHEELNKLGSEFDRYKQRWDKLSKNMETVNKDVQDIHITTDKISKKFDSISNVEIIKSLEEK